MPLPRLPLFFFLGCDLSVLFFLSSLLLLFFDALGNALLSLLLLFSGNGAGRWCQSELAGGAPSGLYALVANPVGALGPPPGGRVHQRLVQQLKVLLALGQVAQIGRGSNHDLLLDGHPVPHGSNHDLLDPHHVVVDIRAVNHDLLDIVHLGQNLDHLESPDRDCSRRTVVRNGAYHRWD